MSPQPLPREHGTMRGYGQHARLREPEPECEDCAEASRLYQRDRRGRQRDRRGRQRQELAARRERWRQQDPGYGEITTTTD